MRLDLKLRTREFSLLILDIVGGFPNSVSTKVVSYQLAKSGTSVGANYRLHVVPEVIMNLFQK